MSYIIRDYVFVGIDGREKLEKVLDRMKEFDSIVAPCPDMVIHKSASGRYVGSRLHDESTTREKIKYRLAFWGGENVVKHDDAFTMKEGFFLFGKAYDIETEESYLCVTSEISGIYPVDNNLWSPVREVSEYPYAITASGSRYYLVNPFVDFSTEEFVDLRMEVDYSSRRRNAFYAFLRKLEQ